MKTKSNPRIITTDTFRCKAGIIGARNAARSFYSRHKANQAAPLSDKVTLSRIPGSRGLTPRQLVEYPQLRTIKSGERFINIFTLLLKKLLIGKK